MTGTKRNVLGVWVDAVNYQMALDRIMCCAERSLPLSVTALAVHGVMTGVLDRTHRYRLNHLDLVVPDGQPVRWALNLLHSTELRDRVYGPELTLRVCEVAAQRGVRVYLYGSLGHVVRELAKRLQERFPNLILVGYEPSTFRTLNTSEKSALVKRIRDSGASLTLVGLGCPRQEVWVYEYRDALAMPLIAVGAAFDFLAGLMQEAPPLLQRAGLEWAYRLYREPRRLWRRYVYLNPMYLGHLLLQATGLRRYDPGDALRPGADLGYG